MGVTYDVVTEAVLCLAAKHEPAELEQMLGSLSDVQVRWVAAALAVRVVAMDGGATAHRVPTPSAEGLELSGPTQVCEFAIAAAAKVFGTTPEQVLSPARPQQVCDARAVAMSAARANGLSLPQIATEFAKDHGSVIHAVRRTEGRPRLAAAAALIADDIASRYQHTIDWTPSPPLRLVQGPSAVSTGQVGEGVRSVVSCAIDAAADSFATQPDVLRGSDRTRVASDARAVAMTVARLKGMGLAQIAAEFGHRHHTVVLHATRRVESTPPLLELANRIAADLSIGPGSASDTRAASHPSPTAAPAAAVLGRGRDLQLRSVDTPKEPVHVTRR